MCSSRTRAISSTQRSTADSIPSPSRSIFRKPASAHDSFSHWTIWRPSIAHGWIGQMAWSGWVAMTMPPGCWLAWRGRAIAPLASFINAPPRRGGGRGGGARRGGAAGADRAGGVALDLAVLPGVGGAGDALDLPRREPERLAEVAHRAA